MADIGPVTKSQKNTHQGYKFRGIDQFVNALHPALVKHGVVMVPEVLERVEQIKEVTRSNGNSGVDKHVSLKVKYTFWAEDGSNVSTVMVGEGVDSGDKATNKALSASLKYALIQTFSVPTEDMAEADLESPELGKARTAELLQPGHSNSESLKATVTSTQNTTPLLVDLNAANATEVLKPKSSFRKPKKTEEAKPANGNGKSPEEDFFNS